MRFGMATKAHETATVSLTGERVNPKGLNRGKTFSFMWWEGTRHGRRQIDTLSEGLSCGFELTHSLACTGCSTRT
jgi:hypothetical protein